MTGRRLALLALPFVLVACTIGGTNEYFGDPKLLVPGQNESSQITVLRTGGFMDGGNYRFTLELDGTPIARLGGGDYVQVHVPPGEHFLMMDFGHDAARQLQRFETKLGEHAYFRFWNSKLGLDWYFARLSTEEGRAAVESGEYSLLKQAAQHRP